MIFQHRFRVRAPLAAVADFHRQTASMGAITPPPIVVHVHRAPAEVNSGESMEFTLWMGPLPVRWVAQFEDVRADSFVDLQVRGPFAQWIHRHTFVAVDAQTTEVIDDVRVQLHENNRWWQLVGFSMWMGLPLLFAYRGWRTRRILERMS